MRRCTGIISRTTFLLSGTALFAGFILPQGAANAACNLVPTGGNDAFVCDSGTHVGNVLDLNGNNSLTMPAGGTGTIDGNVTFGPGADTIEIHSGEITGEVQQGDGVDDFVMTGGQIGRLNQGGHFDTFFMSDGRIIDAFDDGDYAEMTGGRIGRVNMKLADNVFIMSDGTIDGNLVAGFGNDMVELSGGTIGGNISVSGGDDSVSVTGGTVGGEVRVSVGTDTFTWDGGGIIYGAVDLGGGNDTASLSNLTNANIGDTPRLTGGTGTDALTFDNVKTDQVARFDSWEAIDLTNDSQLIFDDMLTLGDSGTGTGTLTVDSASTLYGGSANGGVTAFTADQFANVINAGRIDLTNGGASTSDTFTIGGNYAGDNGQLFLDTVLGDDSSASDKLVIDGGTASGTTGMNIINAGGSGDTTVQDGIMVIEAVNGGSTDSGAFALNGRVAAGAYEYFLFKGGVSENTEENWYLRSTVVENVEPAATSDPVETEEPEISPPPPPSELPDLPVPSEGTPTTDPVDPTPPVEEDDAAPEAPPEPPPAASASPPPPAPPVATNLAPIPGGVTTPPTPGATRVEGDVVPLYRIEVPAFSVVPPVAQYLALSTLGTFHERRGEQFLLRGGETYLPATWGRLFGQSTDMKWDGTVAPSFDGNLYGFQAGQDLLGRESDSGHTDRVGLFVSYARMDGDVKGQALGWNDLAVGELDVNGTSIGGYWTHIGPNGWYLDGVLMGTWFGGDTTASTGESIDVEGTGVTASLEGGYPVALTERWTLEPQAQLIWQHLSLDDQTDSFSTITFDTDDALTGRVGFRLQGSFPGSDGRMAQPYLKANLWHNFSADQTVRFNGDPIVTEIDGTSLELGGGIVASLTEKVSVFAVADYTTNLGGEKKEIFEGNLGLSIKW